MGGVLHGNFTLEDMAYHLRCDIAHDHTPAILGNSEVAKLIRPGGMPYTDEDTAVKYFMEKLIGDPRLDLASQFKIITPTEQNPNATDFVFPATQNSDVKILHDAGPKLYVFLGATQLITFGTILDTAMKPGEGRRLVSQPKESTVNLDVLGFAETVGPLEIRNMTDSKVYTTLKYKDVSYDPVRMQPAVPEHPLQAKELNIPKGFYASVNDVKGAINAKRPFSELFVVGKALGDGLQVLSLSPKYNSEAFSVLSTEDRLNHIRAIAYNVSSVLISRVTVKSPIRIARFMPSTEFLKSKEEQIIEVLERSKDLIKLVAQTYDTVISQFEWDGDGVPDGLIKKPYRTVCVSLLKKFKLYVLYRYYSGYKEIEESSSRKDIDAMRVHYNVLKSGISSLCPKSLPYRKGTRNINQTFVICNPRANECTLPIIESKNLQSMKEAFTALGIVTSEFETTGFTINYANGSDTGLAGAYKLSLVADKGIPGKLSYTQNWFGPEEVAPPGIPHGFPPLPNSPTPEDEAPEGGPPIKRQRSGSRRSDPPTDDFWYFEQYVREFAMDPLTVMLVAQKSPDSAIPDRGALATLAGDIDLTTLPDIGKGPWKPEESVWNAFTANLNAAHSEYPQTKFPWPATKPEIKNELRDFYLQQETAYREEVTKLLARSPISRKSTKSLEYASSDDGLRQSVPITPTSSSQPMETDKGSEATIGQGRKSRLRKSTIRVRNAVDLHKRTRRARRLRKPTSRTRNSRLVRFNAGGAGQSVGDGSAAS